MKNNKRLRRVLAIILSLVMLAAGLPDDIVMPAAAAGEYGISNPTTNSDGVTTWDCIYFGNYWQNDTNGDGTADTDDEKEPIKWRVLSVDGNDAFLLADKSLDCRNYNETGTSVTWETCTLRSWLNGYGADSNAYGKNYNTDNFIDAAFSGTEKSAIKETSVVNDDNLSYGTEGGNDTQDKVYLLSIAEAGNADYGFDATFDTSSETRYSKNTEYAKGQGAYTASGDRVAGNGWWWLRSPREISYDASYVDFNGWGGLHGNYVNFNDIAVRPALHLNLSSAMWRSAGKVTSMDTKRTNYGVTVETDKNGKRTITVSPTVENTIYAIVNADGDGTPLLNIPTVDENGLDVSANWTYKDTPGYYKPGKSGPDGKLVFTVDPDKEYVIYVIKLDDDTKDAIIVGPDLDLGNPEYEYDDKGTGTNTDDTVTITVDPADEDSKYAILKKEEGKYVEVKVTYDTEKKEYVYDPNGDIVFSSGKEVKVVFSVLPAGGTYKVVSIRDNSNIPEFTGPIDPNQILGGSSDITPELKPSVDDFIGETPSEIPSSGAIASPGVETSASSEPDTDAGKTPTEIPKKSAEPITTPIPLADQDQAFLMFTDGDWAWGNWNTKVNGGFGKDAAITGDGDYEVSIDADDYLASLKAAAEKNGDEIPTKVPEADGATVFCVDMMGLCNSPNLDVTDMRVSNVKVYADNKSVSLNTAKIMMGDIEGKGNFRMGIANMYGPTKDNEAIDVENFTFESSLKVCFTLSGIKPGTSAGAFNCDPEETGYNTTFAKVDGAENVWSEAGEQDPKPIYTTANSKSTPKPTSSNVKDSGGYTAIVGFQTSDYDCREIAIKEASAKYNEWLKEQGKEVPTQYNGINIYLNGNVASLNSKTGVLKSPEKVELYRDATVADAKMTEDGEYTVSVSGLNLNDADKIFNMLYVDTDIPVTAANKNTKLTASSIKVNGEEIAKDVVLPNKGDNKTGNQRYQFMIADVYAPGDGTADCPYYGNKDDVDKNLLDVPTGSFDVEITFAIEGADWASAPFPEAASTDNPAASANPTITVTPRPTATVSPEPTATASPSPQPTATSKPRATASPAGQDDRIKEELDGTEVTARSGYKKSGYKYKPIVKLEWTQGSKADGYMVQRRTGQSGEYTMVKDITSNETISWKDSSVKKGVTYQYRVCAYGTDSDGKRVIGDAGNSVSVTVGRKVMKPRIAVNRRGRKITLIFKKAEGSGFQTQYRYVGNRKWTGLPNLGGGLKRKITKPLRANGFRLRVRTYTKVNGKRLYSEWSKPILIR